MARLRSSGSNLVSFVVQKITKTPSGILSNSSRRAVCCASDKACASSIIYTTRVSEAFKMKISLIISSTSAFVFFCATFIFITCELAPVVRKALKVLLQLSHNKQGLPFTGSLHVSAKPVISAQVLFPVPYIPLKTDICLNE